MKIRAQNGTEFDLDEHGVSYDDWGVLIMDLFQFVLKMGMVIVLAIKPTGLYGRT